MECIDRMYLNVYVPGLPKLYINGNEWAERQAAKAAIEFTTWTTVSPPSTTLLPTGLAQLAETDHSSPLRAAARWYQRPSTTSPAQ